MKKILTVALFVASLSAFAQQTKSEAQSEPYIEVVGTAEMKVVPDIIYISITLKDKVVNKSDYPIAEQEQKLKSLLNTTNISLDNLSLLDAASDIITYKGKEKGVEEVKTYLLKVSTAAQAGAVFRGLHENNIKEASITRTDHSKKAELNKQVRINAIKAAQDKATYLLEAIGQEPGKPLVVTEENTSPFSNSFNYRENSREDYDKDGLPDYIDASFNEITIAFSYYIKYTIK